VQLATVGQLDGPPRWNVGQIVGPSGSGKSTIARKLWPDQVILGGDGFDWSDDGAVVDDFPPGVKESVGLLTAVGFGSPPAWLRPYRVLSTGEQFRATLARALAEVDPGGLVVFDEFTSTVDRQVAQVGSHAVQKAVRRRHARLVAITCHFDVIDWLQPDWVFRPDSVDFEWRRLQRHPPVHLEVHEVPRQAWDLFRQHHYLSADLHVAAKCVCAFVDGQPIAFNAYYRFPHPKAKDIMVSHRTVVLPDYQGLGIGGALTEHVGEMLYQDGWRYRATLAHPALIAYRRRSARWRESTARNMPSRSAKPKRLVKQHASSRKLATRTFEYVPLRSRVRG
jgi:GNAT superfamily N-acetyltransferase